MGKKFNIDDSFFKKGAGKITDKEMAFIANSGDAIEEKARKDKKLSGYLDDIKTLLSLVRDYVKGRYRDVSYFTIATIVFTIAYLLNVFDFVPDFIPGLGVIDDVTVLTYTLSRMGKEIEEYRKWKATQPD